MGLCNGYPDIALVPPVGNCCSGAASLAINKLPTAYPQVLSAENLQRAYEYTVEDFNLPPRAWDVFSYTVESSADLKENGTVASTCSVVPEGAEDSDVYYSYYNTVINLQQSRVWIVEPLTCDDPSKGITKGPAVLTAGDMSILPSPTVTPAVPQRVRVNNPWHNVLQVSANNVLFSNPPRGDCKKWKLVYDSSGTFPKIYWKCDEDDDEHESLDPVPEGSEWDDECAGFSLTLRVLAGESRDITGKTLTETELNSVWNSIRVQATPKWTGSEVFEGDSMVLWDADVTSPPDADYAPQVQVSYDKNREVGISRMAPGHGYSGWPPTIPIDDVRALRNDPTNDPTRDPSYAPCCMDIEGLTDEEKDALNKIGKTKVSFSVITKRCGIIATASFFVKFDEKPEEGDVDDEGQEVYTGYLSTDLSFRDLGGNPLSALALANCEGGRGDKLTGTTTIQLCATVTVEGGRYCSCRDKDSINVSGKGVIVAMADPDYFEIPRGVYDEGQAWSFCKAITVTGNGTTCSGELTASVFDGRVSLPINPDCKCRDKEEEIDDIISRIDIRGDGQYIEVDKSSPDADGKVTYTVRLINFAPCEDEEEPEDDDFPGEGGDPEDPNDPSNPDIPNDDLS